MSLYVQTTLALNVSCITEFCNIDSVQSSEEMKLFFLQLTVPGTEPIWAMDRAFKAAYEAALESLRSQRTATSMQGRACLAL